MLHTFVGPRGARPELIARSILFCLLALAAGCEKLTPLEDLKCPCAAGFVCCENRCLAGKACPGRDPELDAGSQGRPDGPAMGGKPDGPTVGAEDAFSGGAADVGADAAAPRYVDISVGERHVCVVRGDQSIGCWGNNEYTNSFPPAGKFKQVSTGRTSRCGLTMDGSIRCWGLCTNDPTDPCNRPPEGPFSQLSVGSDDRCAVALDGSVACWGSSAPPPPAGAFQKVAVGKNFGCGLKGQEVICWGSGAAGMQVPRAAFTDVAAAADWACGVTLEGAVRCWGTPPLVPSMPPLQGLSGLTLGPNVGCALDAGGGLKCWAKTGAPTPVPSSAQRFASFSLGSEDACGITKDGDLSCPEPAPPAYTHPPSVPVIDFCPGRSGCWITSDHQLDCPVYGGRVQRANMARVFCHGTSLTCALTRTGELHCWGQDTPVSSTSGPFTEVALADEAVCALRADKTVKCFGSGLNALGPAGTFRALAATSGYVCGLRTDGTMACWGALEPAPVIPGKFVALSAGSWGPCALDEGGRIACHTPTASPGPPPPGKFTEIAMSPNNHACGLRDGLAVCWGLPGVGPLRARQAPPGAFTSIRVSDQTSCGLRPDGSLVCWGGLEWPDEPRPTW